MAGQHGKPTKRSLCLLTRYSCGEGLRTCPHPASHARKSSTIITHHGSLIHCQTTLRSRRHNELLSLHFKRRTRRHFQLCACGIKANNILSCVPLSDGLSRRSIDFLPVSVNSSRPKPRKFLLIEATRPAKGWSATWALGALCSRQRRDSRSSLSLSQKSQASNPLSILANWENVSSPRLFDQLCPYFQCSRLKDIVPSPPRMPFSNEISAQPTKGNARRTAVLHQLVVHSPLETIERISWN